MATRTSAQLLAVAQNRNEARALRVFEIAADFTSLQAHIQSLATRQGAMPPDQESRALIGYALLAQCQAEARSILAQQYNPRDFNLQPGNIPEGEAQRAQLQRIVLDIAARRFRAHKIYLRAAAATRWIMNRNQVLQGQRPNARHTEALRAVDQRLRQEVGEFTDQYVFNDLRNADRRKEYWLAEDPALDRILAWARTLS